MEMNKLEMGNIISDAFGFNPKTNEIYRCDDAGGKEILTIREYNNRYNLTLGDYFDFIVPLVGKETKYHLIKKYFEDEYGNSDPSGFYDDILEYGAYNDIYSKNRNIIGDLFIKSLFDEDGELLENKNIKNIECKEKLINKYFNFDASKIEKFKMPNLIQSTIHIDESYNGNKSKIREIEIGANCSITSVMDHKTFSGKEAPVIKCPRLKNLQLCNYTITQEDFNLDSLDFTDVRFDNKKLNIDARTRIGIHGDFNKKVDISLRADDSIYMHGNLSRAKSFIADCNFIELENNWSDYTESEAVRNKPFKITELRNVATVYISSKTDVYIKRLIVSPNVNTIGFGTNSLYNNYHDSTVRVFIDEIVAQNRNEVKLVYKNSHIAVYLKGYKLRNNHSIYEVYNSPNPTTSTSGVKKKTNKLKGEHFVITGKLNNFKNRQELVNLIVDNGGIIDSKIQYDTDYLITNDKNSDSSKCIFAREYHIKMISENTLIKKVK